ncbi:MAG: hypothetical protein QXG39_09445 [Candidatus Aenigmatarchaeota archaeon]
MAITKRIEDLVLEFIKADPNLANIKLIPGSPLYELVVRTFAIAVSGFETELKEMDKHVSLANLDALTLEDLENIASNFLVPIQRGSRTIVTLRILFENPTAVVITNETPFYYQNYVFYPTMTYSYSSSEMAANEYMGYYYIDIDVISNTEGVSVPVNVSFSSNIPYYIDIIAIHVVSGTPPDDAKTAIEKIRMALNTRELVTKDSLQLHFLNRGWHCKRFLALGAADMEVGRQYVYNSRTGHAVDIYCELESPAIETITTNRKFPVLATSDNDDWFEASNLIYFLDLGYSDDEALLLYPPSKNTYSRIDTSQATISIGTTQLTESDLGSYYGEGFFGAGPYGVGTDFRAFLREVEANFSNSVRQHKRLYINSKRIVIGEVQISNLINKLTYIDIQENLDKNEALAADFLVREFFIGKVYLKLRLKYTGFRLDIPAIKKVIIDYINTREGVNGVDISGIVSEIEKRFPAIAVELPPEEFYMIYTLPDGREVMIKDPSLLLPKSDPVLRVSARIYRYIADESSISIVY